MITIYGYAKNVSGKIEQVRALKTPGKPITQQFTGVLYKNEREANADVLALNTATALERRSFERMHGATQVCGWCNGTGWRQTGLGRRRCTCQSGGHRA